MEELLVIVLLIVAIVLGALFYFLPSIVAFKRNHANKTAILMLNIFLGWSLVGWVISLVWAFKNETATNI